jgi:hypothetical protein
MKMQNNALSRLTLITAIAVAALLAFSASQPVNAQAPNKTKIVANGGGASGGACDSMGLCNSIEVSRNNNGSGTTTSISLFTNWVDPVTGVYTLIFGGGVIPNECLTGDVPGQALKNLSLDADIAKIRAFNPDFFAHRIVCAPQPCPCACEGGPLLEGTLTAAFIKTDAFTSRDHGISERRINLPDGSSINIRSGGITEFSSASGMANFFGRNIQFFPDSGGIGLFRSRETTIEKTAP